MSPDEFWSSTLDEAILKMQGKVDELRFYRNGFNLIHCSLVGKERVDILKALPLPFDDELDEATDTDEMFEEYRKLKEAGVLDG